MTDATDDLDTISIQVTYCPDHPGLWPHECGCEDLTKPARYLWVQIHALDEITGDLPAKGGSCIEPDYFHYGTREELEKAVNRPKEWVCFQEIGD